MSGNRRSAAERRERAASGNSEGTVARSSGGTANLKPWKPGQSGNPQGRPKGIAAVVKDRVEPSELVDILLDAARDPRAKVSERIAAVRELADRGWGKAPAFAAIELSAIAAEVQLIADELAARRKAPADSGASAESASG